MSRQPETSALAVEAARQLLALLYARPKRWRDVTIGPGEMPTAETLALFNALRSLNNEGTEPGKVALCSKLEPQFGEASALAAYTWLVGTTANDAHLPRYEETLTRFAQLTKLKALHNEIGRHIEDREVEHGWAVVHRASSNFAPRERGGQMRETLLDVVTQIERPQTPVPTGIMELDNMLDGGMRGGEVMVLAARPSVGKSTLLLQIILNMAERGDGVGLWTLEMSQTQWVRRAISALSLVPAKKIRRGGKDVFSDDEMLRMSRVTQQVNGFPIWFADNYRTTPADFRLNAAIAVRQHGCRALAIDYIQLMQPEPGSYNRENEVATLSRTIKLTALELDVPVIALAQLSRNAEDRVPKLSDLRESGALEQDADEVLFIHRPMDPERHVLKAEAMMVLAKNRDGETGTWQMHMDGATYRFEDGAGWGMPMRKGA